MQCRRNRYGSRISLSSQSNTDYVNFVCDAIAPTGIGDIKGTIFIEIRHILREKTLKSLSPSKSSEYLSLYIINQDFTTKSRGNTASGLSSLVFLGLYEDFSKKFRTLFLSLENGLPL